MAHITNTLQPHFTGQVGPVRFTNGHAETDDPELLAYFQADRDRYAVDVDVTDPEALHALADAADLLANDDPED